MTVNVDLIDKIIEAIKHEPRAFRMGTWMDNDVPNFCGTAACIGGWAWRLGSNRYRRREMTYSDWETVAAELGLPQRQASELFYMSSAGGEYAMHRFDASVEPQVRVKIAVDLLERVKSGENTNWADVLYAHGLDEIVDEDGVDDGDEYLD